MIGEVLHDIKKNKLDYALTFGAIAYTGIHFFSMPVFSKLGFFLLLIGIFFHKDLKIDNSIIVVTLLFIVLLFAQQIAFDKIIIKDYFDFLIPRVFISYLLIKILGMRFAHYYVRVIYIYALISLIFWGLTNILPGFYNFIETIPHVLKLDPHHRVTQQFILYTYEPDTVSLFSIGLTRNPGPFIEPGAWGLFLSLAFIFSYVESKGKWDRIKTIFLITLLTTFSTASFASLFILLTYIIYNSRINALVKILSVISFLLVIIWSYQSFDFLGNKISKRFQHEMDKPLYGVMGGRFYGARKALYVLEKYPIYGRGLTDSTWPKNDYSKEYVRYGITSQISQTGIPISILYLLMLYRSLGRFRLYYNYHDKKFMIFSMAALLASMFSQDFGFKPIFMMLIFTPLIFSKKRVIYERQK